MTAFSYSVYLLHANTGHSGGNFTDLKFTFLTRMTYQVHAQRADIQRYRGNQNFLHYCLQWLYWCHEQYALSVLSSLVTCQSCYTSLKSLCTAVVMTLFTLVSSKLTESSVDRFTESVLGSFCMLEIPQSSYLGIKTFSSELSAAVNYKACTNSLLLCYINAQYDLYRSMQP